MAIILNEDLNENPVVTPYETSNGTKFFVSTGRIRREGRSFLFGVCEFKDKISNAPKGAKIKIKSVYDDFVLAFVKYDNKIKKCGLYIIFDEKINEYEFMTFNEMACNSRINCD